MFSIKRSDYNPILAPNHNHPWESFASFNGAPVQLGDKTVLVYRAMSAPEKIEKSHMSLSTIGAAFSKDGNHFGERIKLIEPSEEFDAFGCEDPRVTKIDDTYYIFYTALGGFPFSHENIKVAVAITKDFKTIETKHLVTPFNAKAMVLFPEKVNGKYAAFLTVHTDLPPSSICYVEFDSLEDIWSVDFWNKWYANYKDNAFDLKRKEDDHVEVGGVPLKTDKGWLFLYSHIQHYGHENVTFGIEALLLDAHNPRTILGRSKGALIVPEEHYEKIGIVKNITFPSGGLIHGNILTMYYGGADTYCAKADVRLDLLLDYLLDDEKRKLARYEKNPILTKRNGFAWEAKGVLNPAAIDIDGTVYILYRAFSDKNVSSIGLALSKDGYTITERLDEAIYKGRASFEINPNENGYGGCEDPRIVRIDDTLYMTYTAYDGTLPRVAVSSISVYDFVARHFDNWSQPIIITPLDIDNKDSVIFPEKVDDKYFIIHRAYSTICGDYVKNLDFTDDKVNSCIEVLGPRPGMWDGAKVGLATPPIKTDKGWLVFYHGVSSSSVYRLGLFLGETNDPSTVLARTTAPILEPEEDYELHGFVPNVVFPTGVVLRGDTVFIYYGGADEVIGVAAVKLNTLLDYVD